MEFSLNINKNILKIDHAYYMPSEIIQNSEFVIREKCI